MRRRLLTAMLLLVAGTVVLAGLGAVLLIRTAATTSGASEIRAEAAAVNNALTPLLSILDTPPRATAAGIRRRQQLLTLVKASGNYDSITTVGITAQNQIVGTLPYPLTQASFPVASLLNVQIVSGVTDHEAYALIPLALTANQLRNLDPSLQPTDTAVLVLTQPVQVVTGGIGWLLLIGAGCLAVAALVAYWLARRFSKPLAEAAATTERIAAGDLGATMPVREPPEIAALATSINVMTERLREARDQERRFLLSVSHDLRTPLTSIRGYAEAIADGATNDPTRAAGVIVDETARLERLVQDLLDLARLGAHRFGLKLGPVDVAQLARTVGERFAAQAQGAGIGLEVDVPEPLWVVADGDRLVQVLDNLLENAFAFARARIAIGTQRSGDQAVIWVADDGGGISPDLLSHVFEPHFTSDRASARRNGARTGLGLAIVAELAQAMGGGVRAESPVAGGVGTRLTVWLPLSSPGPRGVTLEPRSAVR